MSADRLAELFRTVRSEERVALLPFMTAGLPDMASSPALFEAMAEAGADGFEVGIPYSDPLMDGPVIQEASSRSLAGGTTVERGLEIVSRVAERTGKPVLVMTYCNPVFRIGPDRFAARAAEAGASGLIVADLSLEESQPIREASARAGLGMVLFVAPTSGKERLRRVAEARPSFIYGVADLGVTGEREGTRERARELAERIRAVTDVPLVMGVGISTPEQARSLVGLADGVIVGSALVRRVLEADDAGRAAVALGEAVGELAAALR